MEIQESEWSALREHLSRDVVITVFAELDLLEVALKVAEDDKAQVAEWIEKGLLGKPTDRELALWERQLDKRFRFVIVAPYVLIQAAAY